MILFIVVFYLFSGLLVPGGFQFKLEYPFYFCQVQAQVSFEASVQLISFFCEKLDNRTKFFFN